MAVSQRAWDVLTAENEKLRNMVELERSKFVILDAQVGRLWNQLGQLSKQHQDALTIITHLATPIPPKMEEGQTYVNG